MTVIVITGVGITGKSLFRELLAKIFSNTGLNVKEFDADYDYGKIPLFFTGSTTYIVEDVHATTDEAIAPLDSYDLIVYVKTGICANILFWLSRMITWFKNGQYLWDQKNGWCGTGKKYNFRNIPPILKGFLRDLRNRKKWIDKDIKAILASKVPYVIIQSQWAPKHIKFCVHHSKN